MSRPNFRIVEGECNSSKIDMEQLKLDYLNPNVSVNDILAKYRISYNQYSKLRPKLVEMTGESRKVSYYGGKPQFLDVSRYITQDPFSGKYRVAKYLNGSLKHFGRYETMERAIEVRDVLVEHDWDLDFYLKEIKPHKFSEFPQMKEEDIISDFERDFLDGMSIKDLRKKYGMSKYHYNNLSTSLKHKYGLNRKPCRVKV